MEKNRLGWFWFGLIMSIYARGIHITDDYQLFSEKQQKLIDQFQNRHLTDSPHFRLLYYNCTDLLIISDIFFKLLDHANMLFEITAVGAIIFLSWLGCCWKLFLSLRQIHVFKNEKCIPSELEGLIDQKTFNKARLYGLDEIYFEGAKTLFTIITNTCVICFGWMYNLWSFSENLTLFFGYSLKNEMATSCFFIIILNTLTTITNLPFTLYKTFVLEEKHGFNNQTIGFFIKDNIKKFIITQTHYICPIFIYNGPVNLSLGGNMFLIWVWLFSCILSVLLELIYPSIIAPLFDQYSPLPEGPLRSSIENLAASLKFPLGQLYVVEGSKRSTHSNAYLYGLFGTKRIVLFDTLLGNYTKSDESKDKSVTDDEKKTDESDPPKKKGCSDAEVLAVLAHELGHWSHGHIYINLFVKQLNLLLEFAIFVLMFKYTLFYTTLGFPPGVQPILVGLITIFHLLFASYNIFVSFPFTFLSRKFEFQADNFAISLGFREDLKKSVMKINSDNLGFPIYDSLYSTWHHSHPTLLQRIENLNNKSKKD